MKSELEGVVSREPSLLTTVKMITHWHRDHRDKAGSAMSDHAKRVANITNALWPWTGPDIIKAALLHDVIEDCDVDHHTLADLGFSKTTVGIVETLTKPDVKELNYADWIEQIATKGSSDSIRVKIADLTDNLDPARLAQLEMPTRDRLVKKYSHALPRLMTELARRHEGPFR